MFDSSTMPRPTKILNTTSAKRNMPLTYRTVADTTAPPMCGVPYVAVDEGISAPKFVRAITNVAPTD